MELSGKPGMPPRLGLIMAIAWSALGLYWCLEAVQNATAGSYGTNFYFGLILGIAFVLLSTVQWIAWSNAKRSTRRMKSKGPA